MSFRRHNVVWDSTNNNHINSKNFRNKGYDCESASTNLTTLSLISIEECDIALQRVNANKVYIHLLQLEFKSVKVIQCKVEIDRTVIKEACRRMHVYGNFEIPETRIMEIMPNQTVLVTLAG